MTIAQIIFQNRIDVVGIERLAAFKPTDSFTFGDSHEVYLTEAGLEIATRRAKAYSKSSISPDDRTVQRANLVELNKARRAFAELNAR